MKGSVLFAVMLPFIFAGVATADIYRYTDSAGETHFVDDIAKVPKKYRKQVDTAQELPDISVVDAGPAPKRRGATPAPSRAQQRSPEGASVEVYMTSWCGYCKKMIRFLDEKGIPYTAYDIEKDSAAARTYREVGGSGVPVVRIGSRVVHGYNPDAVLAYLGRK